MGRQPSLRLLRKHVKHKRFASDGEALVVNATFEHIRSQCVYLTVQPMLGLAPPNLPITTADQRICPTFYIT